MQSAPDPDDPAEPGARTTAEFVLRQRQLSAQSAAAAGRLALRSVTVEYACRFVPARRARRPDKPLILMPSRNLTALVSRTIDNLLTHGAHDLCDILLIDDRSTEDYGPLVKDCGHLDYLRVDTAGGFNFSMLCNIGASVARHLGHDTIILWNNDVWIERVEYLQALLARHRRDGAVLSGAKLLYPFASETAVAGGEPPRGRGGTVQFGGFSWIRDARRPGLYTPVHAHRFTEPDDPRVDCDRVASALTGALMVIDLDWFVRSGGLNPSLAVNFQDVDLSLRARRDGRRIMYYGSGLFFWHAESLSLATAKRRGDPWLRSDRALFNLIWHGRLASLVDESSPQG